MMYSVIEIDRKYTKALERNIELRQDLGDLLTYQEKAFSWDGARSIDRTYILCSYVNPGFVRESKLSTEQVCLCRPENSIAHFTS